MPSRPPGRALSAAFLALGMAAWLPGESFAAEPTPEIDVQGTRLPAACRADRWPATRSAIEGAAGNRAAAQLSTLLRDYLCGTDAAARARVLRHAPSRILQVEEGTGEPTSRRRVSAALALSPQAGQVYGLEITPGASTLRVQWYPDEACLRDARLVWSNGRWIFSRVGSACD